MTALTRREFVKTAAAVIPAVAIGSKLFAGDSTRTRPNVIFVFADQMRAHAMGCMGNKQVITPHLDKLSAEGLLVTNGISAQPVCTPYRAQLLTGRYGHATGVVHNDIRLPDNEVVISELMKKKGYSTGYIGKWHLSGYRKNPVDAKNRRGWDFWAVRNCSHSHSKPAYWLNDAIKPTWVKGWEPEIQTDLAIEFINKNKQSPFCLFLSFGPPHDPYKAPATYTRMYEDKQLKHRPNVSNGNLQDLLHYYAMTTSLDSCMGRLSKAIEDAGVVEDTILIFSSDHGDMLASQGQRRKQRPWEESINVPFILRYPRKVKAGQKRDWIVSSVDIMPTLLGFCGIQIPSNVQGFDYSATFSGESEAERKAAFLFNTGHGKAGSKSDWRGIRTKQWTYAFDTHGDWVMYDLKNDPYQEKNLVRDGKTADQKRQLRKQLATMRQELGERLPVKPNEKYDRNRSETGA